MAEQLAGAASVAVLVLCYVLLVECLTAACVLLAEYIVVQVRNLHGMVAIKAPEHTAVEESQRQTYRLGGGLIK